LSGRFGNFFFDFLSGAFLLQAGQDPEVVAQNSSANHHLTALDPFGSRSSAHEVTDDDADPSFGSCSALHPFAHPGFVLKAITKFANVARAKAAADAVLCEDLFVGFAMDATVAPDILEGEVLVFNEADKGGFDLFGVTGFFFFEEGVDDEAFPGFTEPEVVSKFNFGSAFTSFENLDVRVVKAGDFFGIGEFSSSDDSFVGLADGGGELVEDVLDAVGDLSYLVWGEIDLRTSGVEEFEVILGMVGDAFDKFLHVAEDGFSVFASVFGAKFGGHFHAVGVDVAEEGEGLLGHAVTEALAAMERSDMDRSAATCPQGATGWEHQMRTVAFMRVRVASRSRTQSTGK